MKKFILIFLVCLFYAEAPQAQVVSDKTLDSLFQVIERAPDDTTKVNLGITYFWLTLFTRPDSTMTVAQRNLQLSRAINYKRGEIVSETNLGMLWWIIGDYQKAIDILLKTEKEATAMKDLDLIASAQNGLVISYRDQGNFQEALLYCQKEWKNNDAVQWGVEIGSVYRNMNEPDSALYYLLPAKNSNTGLMGFANLEIGRAYFQKGLNDSALNHYKKGTELLIQYGNYKDLAGTYNAIALLFQKEGKTDSSIWYAKKALDLTRNALFKKEYYESCIILSNIHEKSNPAESIFYLKQAVAAKDSMFNLQRILSSVNNKFNEELRLQEKQREKANYQAKVRTFSFLTASFVFLLVSALLYRNNRHKQKAKTKIENAYAELKATQAQLIQSEKMASLGELTAGIAHEIQNPLNFVNNFSEVNNELLHEMKAEIDKGNLNEVKIIAEDLINNGEKINHHGKRADSIVKGMLQHSRTNKDHKEPTDINALADEYLRLSYHGIRAKNQAFSATIQTDFDNSIGKINIIPQDIGRVLLNLYNNAFYAVREKATSCELRAVSYEPTVTVCTRKLGDRVEIRVGDNGNGIPQNIIDKIFQPFFTTKPTGQGTGLGLSLAYDIVKAHGGEIKVNTNKNEGSEFVILLPV